MKAVAGRGMLEKEMCLFVVKMGESISVCTGMTQERREK